MPPPSHRNVLRGVSLGARALCQLALSVAAIAGEAAVKVLPVLLHIHEHQVRELGCIFKLLNTVHGLGEEQHANQTGGDHHYHVLWTGRGVQAVKSFGGSCGVHGTNTAQAA